jgi:uncharacterized protein YabN with tetrapyrrole methylase and pyrophosphatase domain
MRSGSLTVVGTGIRLSQMSLEARIAIESADKVLYSVADAVTETALQKLNSSAESLQRFYGPRKHRMITYLQMVERILFFVRKKQQVCAAFYGHPGVFVNPSHEAVRRARLEGFAATMLPAVSSEDCLFADLGIDPATSGCQSFEATDFLIRRRNFYPSSPLILWQIGSIGNWKSEIQDCSAGLQALLEVLQQHYDAQHETVLYEAARYASCDPMIERVPLSRIPERSISPVTTLYVPPQAPAPIDYAMVDRLGIPRRLLRSPPSPNGRRANSGIGTVARQRKRR